MTNYLLHRGGETRYLLQCAETGTLIGLMFIPFSEESERVFSYNYGPVEHPDQILNWQDFPELASVTFFSIDYLGNILSYLSHPEWQPLKSLFLAETKYLTLNANKYQRVDHPLVPLWQYTPPNTQGNWTVPCYEIFVNQQGCYIGNYNRLMLALSHEGRVNYQHELPEKIRSIVGNDSYIYGSCDDGKIYELSSKLPEEIFDIHSPLLQYYSSLELLKIDLWQEQLLILDVYGRLTLLDADHQVIWRKKYDIWRGLFLASDQEKIYLGHYHGINCYQRKTGQLIWQIMTDGAILSGSLTENGLIIGTSEGKIYQVEEAETLTTREIKMTLLIDCQNPIYACAIWDNYLIFSDYQSSLYISHLTDNLISKNTLDCGAVLDMKIWQNYLYGVTTEGAIFCVEIRQLLG